MKLITLAAACFFSLLPLHGNAGTIDNADAAAQAVALSGSTRSEVRAEIVQAERVGEISGLRERSYPLTDAQLLRNRQLYQVRATTPEVLHASTQQSQ
jgi:hypothetical protein